MKINHLAFQYFKQRNLAPATKRHITYVIRLLENDINVNSVEQLTYGNMANWRETVCSRNVSEVTWNNYLKHIQLLVKFAIECGILTTDPGLSSLTLRTFSERPKVVELLDLERVLAFINSDDCKADPSWFWSNVVKLLFFTGIRRRQLTGMRWKHVNLSQREIELPASTSKTGRAWTIPMSSNAYEVLYDMRRRTSQVLPAGTILDERFVFDIHLFNSRYKCAQSLTSESLSSFFKRLSNWTKVSISAHRLRHTFATRLASQGQYRELQQLLGHSSVHTTMRYIHPGTEQMRMLVNTLQLRDM